ncbi:MAG: hypothetical protein QOJ19_4792, partial [Acidimicrobiia bacterium]|nr:hypothetical protein [Acidimicrobiia bacterium]
VVVVGGAWLIVAGARHAVVAVVVVAGRESVVGSSSLPLHARMSPPKIRTRTTRHPHPAPGLPFCAGLTLPCPGLGYCATSWPGGERARANNLPGVDQGRTVFLLATHGSFVTPSAEGRSLHDAGLPCPHTFVPTL